MEKVLYGCGLALGCPKVVYVCGIGMCPQAEEENGVVKIFHPGQPEKGEVRMSKEEWNAMIANANPA